MMPPSGALTEVRAATAPSILFLARDLEIGGVQRQLIDLAADLQRRGWRVLVVTFYAGGELEPELARAGVRWHCLRKQGRWDIGGFMFRLASVVREERPDVACGVLGVPNVLLSILKPLLRGARVVWSIAASDMDLTRYDWLMRAEFRLTVLLSRTADLMLSNSRAGVDYHVAQGYPAERMTVIRNGIDVDRFRPDAAARRRLRAEWGIGDDEVLVGLVGRLDPMKDHPNFLRAAAAVAKARPRTRFLCVGDGADAYRRDLHALAATLGLGQRLVWGGARDDIAAVYNALDLKVCSSISEGLPNAVAEAMATGIPCVVTDVGDCAELVDALGWVCRPRDSAALAAAIVEAIDALPCDAERIRSRICTHFSADARADKTTAVLMRLIDEGTACLERTRSTTGC